MIDHLQGCLNLLFRDICSSCTGPHVPHVQGSVNSCTGLCVPNVQAVWPHVQDVSISILIFLWFSLIGYYQRVSEKKNIKENYSIIFEYIASFDIVSSTGFQVLFYNCFYTKVKKNLLKCWKGLYSYELIWKMQNVPLRSKCCIFHNICLSFVLFL